MNSNAQAQTEQNQATPIHSVRQTADTTDFEIKISSDWYYPRIKSGDIIQMRTGIQAKDGDIVALGDGIDANNHCKLSIYTEGTIYHAVAVAKKTPIDDADKPYNLGYFTISKVLRHLYNAAEPHLSNEELNLITRATETAQLQASNMAEVVDGLATFICGDDKNDGGFDSGRTSSLLWQLSYQFDLLAGLIDLGINAEYRLNAPDKIYSSRE